MNILLMMTVVVMLVMEITVVHDFEENTPGERKIGPLPHW
jgi:hypothetical protein